MIIPIIEGSEVRELNAYRFGKHEGVRQILMEAIDACTKEKTASDCIKALARIYDRQDKETEGEIVYQKAA